MELEFTTEQEELRASVRSFLEKECPLELVRAVVESGEPPEKLWGSMVALDWPALAVPEEYGGVGLSIVETAVVVEELGRAVAPGAPVADHDAVHSDGARGGDRGAATVLLVPGGLG